MLHTHSVEMFVFDSEFQFTPDFTRKTSHMFLALHYLISAAYYVIRSIYFFVRRLKLTSDSLQKSELSVSDYNKYLKVSFVQITM